MYITLLFISIIPLLKNGFMKNNNFQIMNTKLSFSPKDDLNNEINSINQQHFFYLGK